MLIELFFGFIILAIPLFFFWQGIIGKFVKTPSKKRWATLGTTFTFIPVLYFFVVAIWYWNIIFYPHREFSQDSWQNNFEKRYEMSEYIIKNNLLLGKSKEEVKQLLGTAKQAYEKDIWTYYVGFVPGIANIDPDILVIEFVNGVVVKVLQRET